MAIVNIKYDSYTSLAVTAWDASFTDGEWWASAVVDNSAASKFFVDILIGGSIKANTSSTGGSIDFYIAGERNTNLFTAGLDTTFVAADTQFTESSEFQERNLLWLGSIPVAATTTADLEFGPWSVGQAIGGAIPKQWRVVVENNSGSALNATETNNQLHYMGVEYEIA